MKIAIITLTSQGKNLARLLNKKLKNDPTVLQTDLYHKQVKATLKEIFHEYDCILGIMASGIMIRSICPLIKDKTVDPAILLMDEKAEHVISILSGHLGGGNDFTMKIANHTGARPVITTATDVNCKLGIDALAHKYFMELDNPSKIMKINKALVSGEKIELRVMPRLKYLFKDELVNNSYKQIIGQSLPSNKIEASFDDTKITLTPKKLVVGLGARKGVPCDMVLDAVSKACQDLGIPLERIDLIATGEPKNDEIGIIEAADGIGLNLRVVTLEELKSFKHPQISKSQFVQKTFGVPGICEPAALLAAGENARLIYRKTKFNKVTIAIAVSDPS
ncbi:MAG TPA: cobalt-precorrin 5A hydrolase [Methanobacterium sp.]|jgi:cobalt-precorrin 5A hydrolase|nr:MAG: cobalamin biosynthesis protein CbiG [Methanobacterium sp.]HOI71989.1 cobalt-precorrin 5A hydrolase [Methanobacterium sp.]HPX77289.1 cobalt-precorrin 5A hydrolase [Methanobacterium sp.]